MRRDRSFLQDVPFARHEYGSIVQTDYPGAHDAAYRARVAALVDEGKQAWPSIPRFEYTEAEHETWRLVSEILIRLQDRYACEAFLASREALHLPIDRIPQLDDVSARLEATTGFMLAPVGGLLEKGEFLSMLEQRVMRCTPYMRHDSYPFFTPEPDIVHELRGHAPMFMHPAFVDMSVKIGQAARHAVATGQTDVLEWIGLFYWYTVEYGLILERGELRIFGAGNNGGIQDMLRSVDPTVRKLPFSLDAIRDLSIDYDAPQEVFFVAESWDQVTSLADALVQAVR
jgi:phenylalanine-4-hydroxylase